MLLALEKLRVPPGDGCADLAVRVFLENLTWQEFEQILEALGDRRSARLSYGNGKLEIITPLFVHENSKVLIGDCIKVLLDELELDYEPAGSTTFKNPQMERGVEPDESFYIQNCQAIRGKEQIDLTVDPPPDLAIEIDITSRTSLENYQCLGVPELLRYNGKRLQINVLCEGQYVESKNSLAFSSFALAEKIPQLLQQSQQIGSACALRKFRVWVREQL